MFDLKAFGTRENTLTGSFRRPAYDTLEVAEVKCFCADARSRKKIFNADVQVEGIKRISFLMGPQDQCLVSKLLPV